MAKALCIVKHITPIFNFCLENSNAVFTHTMHMNGIAYGISLRQYRSVFQYKLDNQVYESPELEKHSKWPYNSHEDAVIYLTVDVSADNSMECERASVQCIGITRNILEAISLHSSNGILYDKTIIYREPIESNDSYKVYWGTITQDQMRDCEEPSHFKEKNHESCKLIFKILMEKDNKPKLNITHQKILDLSLWYYYIIFSLRVTSHRFLLLMIIFEAFFKKNDEEDSGKAAQRIGQLIASSKQERNEIQQSFFGDRDNTFCRIRNKIVHGDPDIDKLKKPIKELNEYICRSIVKIMNFDETLIPEGKDYYDCIQDICEKNFLNLPNT